MRWLKIFLLGIAVVFVAALLTVTWYLSDSGRVKEAIEEFVSTNTGRPLHIDGDFDFSLGSTITGYAQRVNWENPVWSSTPSMLVIEKAEVAVDLWSLISPPIVLRRVNVSDAAIELEWTEAGQFNWEFESPTVARETKDTAENPPDLILMEATLQDIAIRVQSPLLTQPLVVNMLTAEQKQGDEDRLVMAVDTTVGENNATIEGSIGPFTNLLAARDFDFELKVEGAFADLELDGRVGEIAGLGDSSLVVEFSASDIGRSLENLKLPRVTSGKVSLSGEFSSLPGDISAKLEGFVGEFSVDATLGLDAFEKLRGLDLSVSSEGPNARAAGAIAGFTALPEAPYTLRANATETSDGIRMNDLTFVTEGLNLRGNGLMRNYPELNDTDFKLELAAESAATFAELVPELQLPGEPLTVELSVTGNGVNVDDTLSGNIKLGPLRARLSGELAENADFAGSKIDFGVTAPDSQLLSGIFGISLTRTVPVSLEGSALVHQGFIELTDTQVDAEKNTVKINGRVPLADSDPTVNLSAQVAGPDIAGLVGLFVESAYLPPLEYALSGNIRIDDNVRLNNWQGDLGSTRLEVDGDIYPGSEIPAVTLDIKAAGDDFSEPLAALNLEDVPTGPFSLATRFSLSAEGIVASGIQLTGQQRSMTGRVKSAWPEEPEQISFDLVATGQDFSGSILDIGPYEPAQVPFDIRLKGEVDDDHVYIDQAKLKLGGSNVEIAGRIETAPMIAVDNLQISGSGDNLSDLGGTEEWHFGEIPFRITTAVSGSQNQVEVKELRFTAGDSDLEGNLRIDSREKPNYEIQLRSQFLDMASIVVDETIAADEAEEEEESTPDPDARLIPDIPVPYETLSSLNATLDVDIERLILPGLNLDGFRLDGTLSDGRVDIYNISGMSDKGDVSAAIRLTPAENTSILETSLRATGLMLNLPGLSSPEGEEASGRTVDIQISSSGNDLREFAANMDGYLWLQGGARKIENLGIAGIFGDFFSALFDKINPFTKKDPFTTVECDRVFLEAENGVLETSPAIMLLTDKVLTEVRGTIDLSTEELNFNISTSARKGIGLSAGDLVNPFIKVSGTLGNPGVAAGAPGVLEGGAAVATGGVSLLYTGVFKRFFGARDPCGKATESAIEIRRERDPSSVPAE